MSGIVVCGGGMCGLIAAMLLARDGHDVTVLERDPAPPPEPELAWEDWERRGVNQFRLQHFVLPPFRAIVDEELPEVAVALAEAGALRHNVLGPFADVLDPRGKHVVLTARRPVLEAGVAKAAAAFPGVTIRRGVSVRGVTTDDGPGPPRVTGVSTDEGEEIPAHLVVDAAGRRSPMAGWLVAAGARPPEFEEEDSGFVYYGQHVEAPGGAVLGPTLAFFGSVGLLVLPGDRGVVGIGIIAASGDAELRALRHEEPWKAVLRLIPDAPDIAGAKSVGPMVVMAGIEDRWRRYVVDGVPVATGVVSIGDAWAATNPTLGRGISLGARHARLLRGVVREVGTADHAALVMRFDEETQERQTPWYRSTVWHDRHRLAELDAAAAGTAVEPDPLWERFTTFSRAALGDLDLLPHFLSTFHLERRPEEVIVDPAVIALLDARGPQSAAQGPDREALREAIAGAGGRRG